MNRIPLQLPAYLHNSIGLRFSHVNFGDHLSRPKNHLAAEVLIGLWNLPGVSLNHWILSLCGLSWRRNSDEHGFGAFLCHLSNSLGLPKTTSLPYLWCLHTTSFVGSHQQTLREYGTLHDVRRPLCNYQV